MGTDAAVPLHCLPQIPLSSVRERPEAVEVYTGVAAPKRKRVEDQPVITEIPAVGGDMGSGGEEVGRGQGDAMCHGDLRHSTSAPCAPVAMGSSQYASFLHVHAALSNPWSNRHAVRLPAPPCSGSRSRRATTRR